jgi:hypothetical protein
MARGSKFAVRGARIRCMYNGAQIGSHVQRINLPVSHGFCICGQPALCETDNKYEENIPCFGVCSGKMNTTEGQVTYAAQTGGGTVTGRPCMPVISTLWLDAKEDVLIWGKKALTTDSYLVCAKGGFIEFADSGQEEAAKESAARRAAAGANAHVGREGGDMYASRTVSRGGAGVRAATAESDAQNVAVGLRSAQYDGFLIVKDTSGKENLVYLNDKAYLPMNYVSLEELAGILGLFGCRMSVSDNNGRIGGYVNGRYYSIAPNMEEGKIVGPNGKTYGSFSVLTAGGKCYVKPDQFLQMVGLNYEVKPATTEPENATQIGINGVQCEYNANSKLTKLPENSAGYTTYRYNKGLPWGTADTIALILSVSKAWAKKYPNNKIQIGDLSTEDGGNGGFHESHKNGLSIDIRPVRKDDVIQGVKYTYPEYDRQRTEELIAMLLSDKQVELIYFNDGAIVEKHENVKKRVQHDDHLHVKMRDG